MEPKQPPSIDDLREPAKGTVANLDRAVSLCFGFEVPEVSDDWFLVINKLQRAGVRFSSPGGSYERRLMQLARELASGNELSGPYKKAAESPEFRDSLYKVYSLCATFGSDDWALKKAVCPICGVVTRMAKRFLEEAQKKHLEVHRDRVAGTLVGLAAGDSNGGPTEMALRICESLLDKGRFDPDDIFERYMAWFRAGSYDTGPVSASVFALVDEGNDRIDAAALVDSKLQGKTGGINPGHRAAVLAMAPWLSRQELAAAARAEAQLTHVSPYAGDAAVVMALMCRSLILGQSGIYVFPDEILEEFMPETILALGLSYGERYDELSEEVRGKYSRDTIPRSKSGFSPDVLHTAIRFLTDRHCSRGFSSADQQVQSIFDDYQPFRSQISAIKELAGQSNYSPVLVGAMLGAHYGRSEISRAWQQDCEEALSNHGDALVQDLLSVADGLASLWTSANAASEIDRYIGPPYLEEFLFPFLRIQ